MAQVFNKRVFTMKEHIGIMKHAAKSLGLLMYVKKHKLFNKQFKERIMLAVTEVNGCAMCSFVHTKLALQSGMSRENIQALLGGDTSMVPLEESVAILFSQHFASSKESPSDEAIDRLIQEYGLQKAELVLAACNMITMTNAMGIGLDNLYNRIKFNRVQGSKLYRELLNPFLVMLLFPILTILYFLMSPFKRIKLLKNKYIISST